MKHILPINEGWAFVKGCETAPAAIPAGAARVDLPHCWNALDGQDGGSDYWRGPCCYLKTIEKPAGKNVYVEVEAASSVGKIIVNGVEKASHKGGYSLFRANVTDALHDGENLLAIWVDNTQRDDVYPQTADFTFYGGLYRGVNLITVEDSRFDLDYCGGKGFDVSAAVEDGAAVVSLDAFITNPVEGQSVEFTAALTRWRILPKRRCCARWISPTPTPTTPSWSRSCLPPSMHWASARRALAARPPALALPLSRCPPMWRVCRWL